MITIPYLGLELTWPICMGLIAIGILMVTAIGDVAKALIRGIGILLIILAAIGIAFLLF